MNKLRNISELCAAYSATSPWRLGRNFYRYTDCGPWTAFKMSEGEDVYYESREANTLLLNCIGIKLGSIVEGSEAEIEGVELIFPFTSEDVDKALDQINSEASFYWKRDNLTDYCVASEDQSEEVYFTYEDDTSVPDDCPKREKVLAMIHDSEELDNLEEGPEHTLPVTEGVAIWKSDKGMMTYD